MKAKLKALYARIPASAKAEAEHVAVAFAVAFAATAGPLLPEVTHTPSTATVKALLIAAVAAGARAAYPVAKKAVKRLAVRAFSRA